MFSYLRSGLRPVGPVWQGASWLIALGVFAPIASLAWLALGSDWAHWQDLLRYVLPDAAANTAWLLGGVGLVVLVAIMAFTVIVWGLGVGPVYTN